MYIYKTPEGDAHTYREREREGGGEKEGVKKRESERRGFYELEKKNV